MFTNKKTLRIWIVLLCCALLSTCMSAYGEEIDPTPYIEAVAEEQYGAEATPEVTYAPVDPAETLAPTDEPEPADSPESTESAEPIASTEAPIFTETPVPTDTPVPVATAIEPEFSALTLGVGEKRSAAGYTLLPQGAQANVAFMSSAPKIATVDSAGWITAKKKGSAVITLATEGGARATIAVTVVKAPSKIVVSTPRKSLGVGESVALAYTLPTNTGGSVTFSGDHDDVALVSSDGRVQALSAGSVKITAKTYNGKSASLTITVANAPTQIQLDADSLILGRGDSWRLTGSLNEGSAGAIAFTSSHPEIATVDFDGLIHALSEGETEITVSTYNGITASCALTVGPAPEQIALNAATLLLGVKEKGSLQAQILPEGVQCTVKWTSSKPKVVSVDANGALTALKAGVSVVTASTYNGKVASCTVTVRKAPSKVTVSIPVSTLGVGETIAAQAKLPTNTASGIVWTAQPEGVVSIDESGLITALAEGTARVIATTFNGKTANQTIRVLPAPQNVAFEGGATRVPQGGSITLKASVNDGAGGRIVYISENPSVATVDAATGKATTYVSDVSSAVEIEVLPAPTYVKLPWTSYTLGLGDSLQLSPQIDEGALTTFTYKSSKTNYATVSSTGLIKGVKKGSAVITVTTANGQSAKLTVKVADAPTGFAFAEDEITIARGDRAQLRWQAQGVTGSTVIFQSSNPDVAQVSQDGVVTGLAGGEAWITALTYNMKGDSIKVNVIGDPERMTVVFPASMSVGQRILAGVTFEPLGSNAEVTWSVASGNAIAVSADGTVEALREGTSVLRATALGLVSDTIVTVLPTTSNISFDQQLYILDIGETLQLKPQIDSGAAASFEWQIETPGFFTIDVSGVVHPVALGESKVRAVTWNGLYAETTVRIEDFYTPTAIALVDAPPALMQIGDVFTPKTAVTPASANGEVEWTSSNPDILMYNPLVGSFYALSFGYVTVTGQSVRNPEITLSMRIIVNNPELTLVLPARRSTVAEIKATKAQIRAIRDSALKVLEQFYSDKIISSTDYKARKAAIERAFTMYEFAWMTNSTEKYWNAANSEDGAKDFKPGIVYYGLPYTQRNRVNTPASLIKAGVYTDSGKGYYLWNGAKFSDRAYPGTDCSSFASIALWGETSARASDTTRKIATASYYETINDWKSLRTGDLIGKNGHVIIFLYWTDAARTQFMLIEQGGGEAAINTVSCNVRTVAYYQSEGYVIRRPKF